MSSAHCMKHISLRLTHIHTPLHDAHMTQPTNCLLLEHWVEKKEFDCYVKIMQAERNSHSQRQGGVLCQAERIRHRNHEQPLYCLRWFAFANFLSFFMFEGELSFLFFCCFYINLYCNKFPVINLAQVDTFVFLTLISSALWENCCFSTIMRALFLIYKI